MNKTLRREELPFVRSFVRSFVIVIARRRRRRRRRLRRSRVKVVGKIKVMKKQRRSKKKNWRGKNMVIGPKCGD
ncbi:hypothetical protein [Absidia glauca]|uniref:Uncharacterized protein n=1 Tax=Absidia glauca TaxID=4829 RepID=A0A163KMK0_ABSGL|nr:hypothetical protein [Absidia glauca]